MTEEDIVRPTALMADTRFRLKGVSIGERWPPVPRSDGWGGALQQCKDFHLAEKLLLRGWGSEGATEARKPRGEAQSGEGEAAPNRSLGGGAVAI